MITKDTINKLLTIYSVDKNGVIINRKTGKKISHHKNHAGYPTVSLYIESRDYCIRLHRLLAILYIPNPENKPCVNHKDRNRSNFSLSNLEWVTHKENVAHCIANGGRVHYKRPNILDINPYKKLKDIQVLAIRDLIKIGYSQNKIAEIFGIKQTTVSKIHNRDMWKNL